MSQTYLLTYILEIWSEAAYSLGYVVIIAGNIYATSHSDHLDDSMLPTLQFAECGMPFFCFSSTTLTCPCVQSQIHKEMVF